MSTKPTDHRRGINRLRALHANQDGTISIISVFAVLLLTMLLGMVMNVGRHVDGKVRLQNAADAAAVSGASVIARGMNTLTFSNHLLFDVFALTAFLREARDRNAETFVPEILAAWNEVAPVFSRSKFEKFERLGAAIPQRARQEQELVRAYSEWGAAAAERVLPLLEEILRQDMIPEYERAVVLSYPDIAQLAAQEVARRSGQPAFGRGTMLGVLWRTNVTPVGGAGEAADSTMPVLDPIHEPGPGGEHLRWASEQRRRLSEVYLAHWNNEAMAFFDAEGKMCQFSALWRGFTCGQLLKLLDEYPQSNLPHLIRTEARDITDTTAHQAEDFTFIGVAYWHRLPEMLPGLFRNPTDSDNVAYAESRVFVPARRLVWRWISPGSSGDAPVPIGGLPGDIAHLPGDDTPSPSSPGSSGAGHWLVGRLGDPDHWDLLNQSWTAQLVPATQPCIATILHTPPSLPAFAHEGYRLPEVSGLRPEELSRITTH